VTLLGRACCLLLMLLDQPTTKHQPEKDCSQTLNLLIKRILFVGQALFDEGYWMSGAQTT
jgi:hypothetical protein